MVIVQNKINIEDVRTEEARFYLNTNKNTNSLSLFINVSQFLVCILKCKFKKYVFYIGYVGFA